jgi:hypothetical protein
VGGGGDKGKRDIWMYNICIIGASCLPAPGVSLARSSGCSRRVLLCSLLKDLHEL